MEDMNDIMLDFFLHLNTLLECLTLRDNLEDIPLEDIINAINTKVSDADWDFSIWKEHLPSFKPRLDFVTKLLERKDFREYKFSGENFLDLGIELDSPKLVEEYIRRDNKRDLFHSCCSSGSLELIKYLYEKCGYDSKSFVYDCPIKWASINGHLKVVKYLYSMGYNPRAEDDCPIRWLALAVT